MFKISSHFLINVLENTIFNDYLGYNFQRTFEMADSGRARDQRPPITFLLHKWWSHKHLCKTHETSHIVSVHFVPVIHWSDYLFSDWPKAYSEFSKSVPVTSSSCRLCNNHVQGTQGHRWSCHVRLQWMISKGNLPYFFHSMYKTIIRFGFLWYPE